jgi:hypothetical protein
MIARKNRGTGTHANLTNRGVCTLAIIFSFKGIPGLIFSFGTYWQSVYQK